jgi:hypothetical protein
MGPEVKSLSDTMSLCSREIPLISCPLVAVVFDIHDDMP